MLRFHWLAALVILAGVSPWEALRAQTKRPDDMAKARWALLIGVDNYTELTKLRFAGADQRALAEQLVATGFPKDQVFLMHDKAADSGYLPFRVNIERQLDLVLGLADAGDLMIVAFSGHGLQLEGKSYLCPEDARLDQLSGTMIPLDSVYERLGKSKAVLKLLLVDACRNDILPAGLRSATLSRSLGEFGAAAEKPPEGILLLASCGPGQVSIEEEQFGHGVFMHFLLEGLRGKAASSEGTVSLAGLYDYASLQTKKFAARKFVFQTPALKGDITGPFEIGKPAMTQETVDSIGMKLVLIPAGEFVMGSQESSAELAGVFAHFAMPDDRTFSDYDPNPTWFDCEHPPHRIRITKAFYLGAHHVTVGQFRQFVSETGYVTDAEKPVGSRGKPGAYGLDSVTGKWGSRPDFSWRNSGFAQTDQHPVVNVSWNDAVAFCGWLSRKERKTYRLPTEAEWEYACRAGTTTRYYSGDDPETLGLAGNVADAAAKAKFPNWKTIRANDGYVFTSPVGSYPPNLFGLCDMHGNAWQWCTDWYDKDYYARSPVDDPPGPDSGKMRVLRGGAWFDRAHLVRAASRVWGNPLYRDTNSGFRVARNLAD